MADIGLTPDEIRQVDHFRKARDYPGGYRYVSSIIAQHRDFDQNTAFWFERAASINANVRTDAADVYIRAATKCGLQWDGKLSSDAVRNAQMLQDTSDKIGDAVLGGIVRAGTVTNVNVFLNDDIVGALAAGQTIGGWGGAFYYWNAPFAPRDSAPTTVGAYISSHPAEYEKFVACNAGSAIDAIRLTELPPERALPLAYDGANWGELRRLDLLRQAMITGSSAQAPLSVKADIFARARDMILGGKPAGDPDQISVFQYSGAGSGWTISVPVEAAAMSIPVNNPAILAQLNARRQVRLAHQGFSFPQ